MKRAPIGLARPAILVLALVSTVMGPGGAVAQAAPSFSIDDASVTEGNAGDVVITFTVTEASPDGRDHTVDWATSDGSAFAPSDYKADSSTLSFGAADTQKTIALLVHGDTAVEGDETFTVSLSNPTGGGATIADGTGTGTIRNDDTASAPGLSVADATLKEGTAPGSASVASAAFTVSLSPANAAAVTVDYATADGTAAAPADYAATAGQLTFAAGETTKQVLVPIAGDGADEPAEQFTLALTNPSGGLALADAQGMGTILDDDAVDRTPAMRDVLSPQVKIAKPTLSKFGTLAAKLSCPREERFCEGTMMLRVRRQRRVLGMAKFKIMGGKSRTARLRLNKKQRGLFEGSRGLLVDVVVTAADASGNVEVITHSLRLKAP